MIGKSFLDNPRLAMPFRVRRLVPQGSLELPHHDAIVTRSGGAGNSYNVYDMSGDEIQRRVAKVAHVIDIIEPRYRDEPVVRKFTAPSQVKDLMGASHAEVTGLVAVLLKQGCTDAEIAVTLGISRRSVINRLNGLRAKGATDLYRYERG